MGRDYLRSILELFGLARPYWLPFSVAFLSLIGAAAVEVTVPQVVRHTIDRYVVPRYAPDRKTGRMIDVTTLPKWEVERRVGPERYYKTPIGYLKPEDLFKRPYEEILKLRAEDLKAINRMFLLFLLLLVLRFLFNFSFVFLSSWVGQKVANDLRVRTFNHALRLPVSFYDRTPLGVIITRLTNDINAVVNTFTGGFLNVLQNTLMFFAALGLMFALSVRLTLLVLLLIPVILVLSYVFAGFFARAWRKVRTGIARLNAFVQETIWGLKTIQNLRAYPLVKRRFEEINSYLYSAYMGVVYIAGVFRPAINFISYVAIAVVVWYSAGGIMSGDITFGGLVAFLSYIDILFKPVQEFAQRIQTIQSSVAGYEKVKAFLSNPTEYEEWHGTARGEEREEVVVFSDVRHTYDGKRWALKGVSFMVRRGEKVALVGRTGAGKTTVLNLLLGFYVPTEGEVLIYGIPTREWDTVALRSLFAPVMQDLTVFADSIPLNITLGYDLDYEGILKDLGIAYLLKKEYHELSAGERQLVSIARALAFNRPIIVFDEATSNLDPLTELKLQQILMEKFRDKTLIIVAHRLATARLADRIIVLEDGRVVEEGSHEELMERRGRYYELYKLQEVG